MVGRGRGLTTSNFSRFLIGLVITETFYLDIICPDWRRKFIGASADGAQNMEGNISGTVTRFCEEADTPGAKFLRVWCLLHQIALPMKDAYEALDNGAWLTSTTNKIAHFFADFTNLLSTQRTRLSASKIEQDIAFVENEFQLLRTSHRFAELELRTAVDALPADATFKASW